MIELPPVETDLLGFVDRANQQADSNGEELNLGQRDFDVARDYQSFVENPIEEVDKPRRTVPFNH